MGVKGITGTCPSIPAKGVATRGPLGRGTGVRWGTVFPDKSIVRTAAMIFITVIKGTPVVMGVSLGTDQCKFYQECDSVDFWVNKNHNIFLYLINPRESTTSTNLLQDTLRFQLFSWYHCINHN
jgi:hypothetical protein